MFRRLKKGSSSRIINNNQNVDMKLNITSPPRVEMVPPASSAMMPVGPHRMSTSSSEVSPPTSCVSSEDSLKYSSSPETTSMVLVGCPRCLMYVMLSEADPRCPKCKSTVLLDFLHQDEHRQDNDNDNDNDNDDDEDM